MDQTRPFGDYSGLAHEQSINFSHQRATTVALTFSITINKLDQTPDVSHLFGSCELLASSKTNFRLPTVVQGIQIIAII